MSEKKKQRKPEETICPFLVMAIILRESLIHRDVPLDVVQNKCLGERCQMWNPYARRCGLIR